MQITRISNPRTGMISHLEIDDARIVYRNFEGRGTDYNKEGDRNFAIVIPSQELAEELREDGWNVKIKEPKTPDEDVFMYLPVKLAFNDYGPNIWLHNRRVKRQLGPDTVGCLDRVRLASVDLDIRPYDWTRPNGDSGRSAWLKGLRANQALDRFSDIDDEYYED